MEYVARRLVRQPIWRMEPTQQIRSRIFNHAENRASCLLALIKGLDFAYPPHMVFTVEMPIG